MWPAHDATVNAKDASINIWDRGFQFIRKLRGGGHFSGTVVETLRGGKRKCKFCVREDYKYTLSEIQRLSTLQVFLSLYRKQPTARVRRMQVCIGPRKKVPVNMRQLKYWQISRDATVVMSLHRKIPLSTITMEKMRAILSFQDPVSTSVNLLVLIGDKLWST